MAHAAIKSCCIIAAVLAAAFLALALPSAAASSPSSRRAWRRLEMAAMQPAQDLQAKTEVLKEGVATTGLGTESEREVPTGPDPIHHHGRGPRRQSP